MLSVDKNGRMTIEVDGYKWKANTSYYAYIDKCSLLETRIAFVENLYPDNPKKRPKVLANKYILGQVKTDDRGRISPNQIMKRLPGTLDYTEWGLLYMEDGSPYFVRSVNLAEVVKQLVRKKEVSLTELSEFIDSTE